MIILFHIIAGNLHGVQFLQMAYIIIFKIFSLISRAHAIMPITCCQECIREIWGVCKNIIYVHLTEGHQRGCAIYVQVEYTVLGMNTVTM